MFKKVILAIALVCSYATVNAQEAFHSLGVGAEVGLMGFGLQFSMPVVSNHLVLNLGYNFYGIRPKVNFDIDKNTANEGLQELNQKILDSSNPSLYETFDYFDEDLSVTAKGKFNQNVKLLAEYYPSKKSGFHITAGLMFGIGDFARVNATVDPAVNNIYHVALRDQEILRQQGEIAPDEDLLYENLRYSIDDQTFALQTTSPEEDLKAQASIVVNRVKPYFGFGFGRSIPKKRVGFQFELGLWYHGKPSISSPNEVEYDVTADYTDGVKDVMNKIQVYPQMTFRLTGRIF